MRKPLTRWRGILAMVLPLGTGACSRTEHVAERHVDDSPARDDDDRISSSGVVETLVGSAVRAPAPAGAGHVLLGGRADRRRATPVLVSAPPRASDGTTVFDGRGLSVSVRRLGATDAPARADGRSLVYANAWDGVDAVVFSTSTGVEELLIARRAFDSIDYAIDVPEGHRLVQPLSDVGLVEVRDARDRARLRLAALAAWDARGAPVKVDVEVQGERIALSVTGVVSYPVVIDPEWRSATDMVLDRVGHTATLLGSGSVLLVGGDSLGLGLAEIFDPATETFTVTGALSTPRSGGHRATLLSSGQVLVTGGSAHEDCGGGDGGSVAPGDCGTSLGSAEIYDPETGQFELLPARMTASRSGHTATVLPDGRVLLTGGDEDIAVQLSTAEVFDPVTSTFRDAGLLTRVRTGHSAVLLPSGQVLIASGDVGTGQVTSEVYDVGSESSEPVPTSDSSYPSWTGDDLVLVTPGMVASASALYDIGSRTWTGVGCRTANDQSPYRATLLPSGDVLFTGEHGAWLAPRSGGCVDVAEREVAVVPEEPYEGPNPCEYFPEFPLCNAPVGTSTRTYSGTATLLPTGGVLVAGEGGASVLLPVTESRRSTGASNTRRTDHGAALLPSGRVLLVGGAADATSAELFDPVTGSFEPTEPSATPHEHARAVTLDGGVVAVAGGLLEWFHPASGRFLAPTPAIDADTLLRVDERRLLVARSSSPYAPLALVDVVTGSMTELPGGYGGEWSGAEPVEWEPGVWVSATTTGVVLATEETTVRVPFPEALPHAPTVAPLSSDRLLLVAGSTVRLFDRSGAVIPAPDAPSAHGPGARASILDTGEVLVTGGGTSAASLFDPVDASGQALDGMLASRTDHAVTRLDSGQLLVTSDGTAELFDPIDKTFSSVASGPPPREGQSATLLSDGRVLFAGGRDGDGATAATELFDPATDAITPGPALKDARRGHTATLLRTGAVLLAGGNAAGSIEIVDVAQGTTESAGTLLTARSAHAATPLATGAIVFTGGLDLEGERLATVEMFEPETGESSTAPSLGTARAEHTTALLASGRILVAGGALDPVSALETYDPGASPGTTASSPVASPPLSGAARTLLTASGDVFVYGDGLTFRYEPAGQQISGLTGGVSAPFGVATLVPGGLFACGASRCEYRHGSSTGPQVVEHLAAGAASVTPLLGGEILVRAASSLGGGYTLRYGRVPEDAERPRLAAPGTVVASETVTIRGEGLRRMSAVGAEGMARPELAPTLYFVPASTGAPIASAASDFTDDTVTWHVPTSPWTGPGWLYAVVAGVPSEGAFVVVEPAPVGRACSVDAECQGGHCTEGVCCDGPCASGCQSCVEARTGLPDGKCQNLERGASPRFGCVHDDEDVCSPTGSCGEAGECELPDPATRCSTESVPSGVCIAAACVEPPPAVCSADGTELESPTGERISCAPFRCSAGQCLSRCVEDDDCAEGLFCTTAGSCRACTADNGAVQLEGDQISDCGDYVCAEGQCRTECGETADCRPWAECRAGRCASRCDATGDGVLVRGENRAESAPCSPYRCAEGTCLSECASHADCAVGHRCSDVGLCLPDDFAVVTPVETGCGCRLGPRGGSRVRHAAGLLLVLLSMRRRIRPERRCA